MGRSCAIDNPILSLPVLGTRHRDRTGLVWIETMVGRRLVGGLKRDEASVILLVGFAKDLFVRRPL